MVKHEIAESLIKKIYLNNLKTLDSEICMTMQNPKIQIDNSSVIVTA